MEGGSSDKLFYIPFPYIFNLDYRTVSNVLGYFDISTCNQWYMFSFDKNVSAADLEYFG